MKRNICAVFDVDDTLYLERDYVRSGFEAVGRWAAKWLQIRDFRERCWAKFISGSRGSIFNEVLSESGRAADPKLVSALVEIYRTHMPSIALALDAAEALMAISRRAAIAVISDGPIVSQSRKAEALKLACYAAPIIFTEGLGGEFRKPHPKAFEELMRRRPASMYVYIADNPVKDFTAPKRLGWITVRIRRPGGLHYSLENGDIVPDWEMPDCTELPGVLARL
jgi:putative hydrolase of the HAD superfamily